MKRNTAIVILLWTQYGVVLAAPNEVPQFRQAHKLVPDDLRAEHRLGEAIAIIGTTIAIGAPGAIPANPPVFTSKGAVYLYDAITGTQLRKITAADGALGDFFGHSISIDENRVLVGAIGDDDGASFAGAAYLFDTATGNQLLKITRNQPTRDANFGIDVDMSGNTAIIGTSLDINDAFVTGAAYLFDLTTGNQLSKLTADDASEGDQFGFSVAIRGDKVIVGAIGAGDVQQRSGAAYLFDASTGDQLIRLKASDPEFFAEFGHSVALNDRLAVIGASGTASFPIDQARAGAVYVFDLETGEQIHKLTPLDSAINDEFGISVAISNDLVVVGARESNDIGAAYIFDLTSGKQLARIAPNDGMIRDFFGQSVAIEGNTVVVGSWWADAAGNRSGAAYVFVPEPSSMILALLALIALRNERNEKK